MQYISSFIVVFEQVGKMFKPGVYGAFLPENRDDDDFHCP